MNPYDYPKVKPIFNLRLKKVTQKWSCYEVAFASAHPAHYEESNIASGEYFVPRNGERFPFAIILHALGDVTLMPCKILATHLAKAGIASFVLRLIFHSSRTPKIMKGQFTPVTAAEWLEVSQISVIDVRQVVDWGREREEIDDEQVAIIGMSLGGMVSALAMGVDERIKTGAFLLSGGNAEEITWGSRARIAKRIRSDPRCCTRAECRYVYSHYPAYLEDVAKKGFENVTPIKECFWFDPITFSSNLRGRPILMVNALEAQAIPKRATLDLWEACGKPPMIWLPGTHVTTFLTSPLITGKVTAFLKSTSNLA
jgi:Uncharacterized conserved protein (DUF2048).